MRYRRGYRARRRDRVAAQTLERAAGVCDNCGVTHGQRHGPLIACANGLAICRACVQRRRDFKPLGASLCPGEGDRRSRATPT